MAGFNLGEKLIFQGSGADSTYSSASDLINAILPNVYVAAGLVLFFMFILGGFNVISGASDAHKMEEGKKTITFAIMGLLVVFGSYWIIQIIQIVTGLEIL
ncbi:MAG: hypothetical protein DPW11_02475 [bacterium]|nr:hypothetical protein [Candidatus Microgenomates bacterium CPR3]MCQ3944617.1 hypothetical protein [bacterium]RIK52225.1 MAG: hypothetical protein DCC61_00350 [Candidatus Microgenomates bacterium]